MALQVLLTFSAMYSTSNTLSDNEQYGIMASVLAQSHVLSSCGIDALPSSTTPIGWLSRMIQFKEKSRKLEYYMLCCYEAAYCRLGCLTNIKSGEVHLPASVLNSHWCLDGIDVLLDTIFESSNSTSSIDYNFRVSPSLVRFSAFAGSFEEIMSNPAYLDGVLAEGPKKAAVASATVINVYQAIRFLRS
ncbi:hypothetical protein PVK06_013913 [Gossypium arboreum]|uniref:Uncharacterized protein n=1 Tax=Gossypium arboreum TaxID=29729 RepID=A0ABR0PTE0_GOSAR|nr:hypothetical protein PVK06_013913 [Gossypium arboreum]